MKTGCNIVVKRHRASWEATVENPTNSIITAPVFLYTLEELSNETVAK